jgi:hypothetical protein
MQIKKEKKYNIKKEKDYNYSIKIVSNNEDYKEMLYYIILKFVPGFKDENSVFFSAEKVESLESYLKSSKYHLSEQLCVKLIDDISKQLNYYIKNGVSIYGIDLDDIIVINDNIFIIVSTEYILDLNNIKNSMNVYFPLKRPYFGNPELYGINVLPTQLNIKSIYYSIGALITFCIINKYLLVGNEIKSNEEIKNSLEPLKGRKVYWFLLRCLEDDVNKRVMLLI